MGTLTVITEPTWEPVTLKDVKEGLRISEDDEDGRLYTLIKAARKWAEAYTQLKIPSQVVERSYNYFPSFAIGLDVWPLQSIDSVKYDDTASPVAEQTLTVNTNYYADTTTEGGVVTTITGWPSTATKNNSVRVRMTAGYSSYANVPAGIKEGIIAYVGYMYDGDTNLLETAKAILWHHRRL